MSQTQTLSLLRDAEIEYLEVPRLIAQLRLPDGNVQSAPLALSAVTIGTGPGSDLVARDGSISRSHAQLSLTEDGVVLKDLGSKNGTFIKGVRVLSAFLPPGSIATLGGSQLSVVEEGAPEKLELSRTPRFGGAIGASNAMRALFASLERAAGAEVPVLLIGESGTGKEVLARAIHDHSPRRDKPFVVFDCSAVPPTLIESELFGYVKGAFTGATATRAGLFEQAHGGTLFLDELGELPLDLQTRLLRALETRLVRQVGGTEWRPADARIVGATHRDLRARVAAGTFREDLFFRLAVVLAHVPPLRERQDDIPLLVEHFLTRQTPPRSFDDLPPNALALLRAHHWPGNVRELWNTLTRWVLFPGLGAKAIEEAARRGGAETGSEALFTMPLRQAREAVVADFERRYLMQVLNRNGGKVAAAAKAMGCSRQFAYMLMDRHGLGRDDED